MNRTQAARLRGLIADTHPRCTVTIESYPDGATITMEYPPTEHSQATRTVYIIGNGPSAIVANLLRGAFFKLTA